VEPSLELDSYDLIINLVALGIGVGFVPIRALALYGRKRAIRRVAWPGSIRAQARGGCAGQS
jgi:DNA-binding transcriptional LysR family regulator